MAREDNHLTDRLGNKHRLTFKLRELFVVIAAIAFTLFCEQALLGSGAVWAAVVIGGLAVFYIRTRQDLILVLTFGAVVFGVWWAIVTNTERFAKMNPRTLLLVPPFWLSVTSTLLWSLPAGTALTFLGFAFVKFWHFALTRPLQFEIDNDSDEKVSGLHE